MKLQDHAELVWRDYRYFAYERIFARLEVESLFGTSPVESVQGLLVPQIMLEPRKAERLTYFSRVISSDGREIVPRQARLEHADNKATGGRQSTRYSAHCLHEYKGRFNPQVVRAIGNIIGLQDDATILDPFCGSGTTLLEAAHVGWGAFGLDRNPLAVRIANAKLHALKVDGEALKALATCIAEIISDTVSKLSGNVEVPRKRINEILGSGWQLELPSLEYLRSWFSNSVLAQVVAIRRVLRQSVVCPHTRDIFEIILSDQLRKVSMQEPSDLRIRRRKNPQGNYPLASLFADAIAERIGRIHQARSGMSNEPKTQKAELGDVCSYDFAAAWKKQNGRKWDAVITSPPYVSALPYIDTQRLSLVLFGDIESEEVAETERSLIGARELRLSERRELENAILRRDNVLPTSVKNLCCDLLDAASLPGNGFRRKNRPSLVYRYFSSMRSALLNISSALREGGQIALVVGSNSTTLAGREFTIDTPSLLAEIGLSIGLDVTMDRQMDTYPRYDLHQSNSIESERLIVMRA